MCVSWLIHKIYPKLTLCLYSSHLLDDTTFQTTHSHLEFFVCVVLLFCEKCVKQHYFCYINRFLLPSITLGISLVYTYCVYWHTVLECYFVLFVKVAATVDIKPFEYVWTVNLLHETASVSIGCCCTIFSMQVVFSSIF